MGVLLQIWHMYLLVLDTIFWWDCERVLKILWKFRLGYGFTQMFEDEMKPEGWSGAQPPYLYRPGTCFGQKTCHWSPDWARPKDTSWSLISEKLHRWKFGKFDIQRQQHCWSVAGKIWAKKGDEKAKKVWNNFGYSMVQSKNSYLWTSSFGDWWKSVRLCMVITWKRMKQCQPLDLFKGLVFLAKAQRQEFGPDMLHRE